MGLADVFSAIGTWKEQRYDISDKSNVFGMATVVDCRQYRDPTLAELELRMAHRFTGMKLGVGQANDSVVSDNAVIVDVISNGTKVDSHTVPFDTIQALEVDVTDANSLKLQFHLDPAKCKEGGVTVVVEGLTVS